MHNSTAVKRAVDLPARRDPRSDHTVVIEPLQGWFDLGLKELWEHRELLYFLVWRDVKVRYKQTVIGAAWVVLQPLLTMAIFTIVFSYFAKIPSDGLPYPLFAYSGLVVWFCFAQALGRSGGGLVQNAHLVSKVYFPRLILSISAVVMPLFDFLLSFGILLAMLAWYGRMPTWGIVMLPLFLVLTAMTALAFGLWLSALHVRYRDVGYIIPFLIQIWMYASPIMYPVSLVPVEWRAVYGLNPMAGVITGFRWAMLGTEAPPFDVMVASAAAILIVLVSGALYFRHMESTFADVI